MVRLLRGLVLFPTLVAIVTKLTAVQIYRLNLIALLRNPCNHVSQLAVSPILAVRYRKNLPFR